METILAMKSLMPFADAGNELVRFALNALPSGVVVIDSSGTIVFVNSETERLFHFKQDELCSQPAEILVPVRFRERYLQLRNRCMDQTATRSAVVERDLRGLRKDDVEFPMEIRLSSFETGDGLFVLTSIIGISEHREAEQLLPEDIERIRRIFNMSLDAVVTISEDGAVTDWNPKAESMFGWQRDDVLGQKLSDLIIPQRYREAHENGLKRFLKTGEGPALNKRLDLFALRRSGEEFPVELTISPIRVGDVYEFSAFLRDVSEQFIVAEKMATAQRLAARNLAEDAAEARKRAERVEERLNLALQSARVGTWNWNVGDDIITWDDHIPLLFGRKTGTLPQLLDDFLAIVHPADSASVSNAVRRSVDEDVPYDTEYRVIWPDGSLHSIGARGKVYRDEHGKPLQMTGVCWDITDRKRSEQALAAVNAQLAGVLNASTQVAIIATDVNGLITVFNTGAENLLGYTAEEMVGHLTPAVFHVMEEVQSRGRVLTRDLGYTVEGFEVFVAYARRGQFDRREWTYVRKDGSRFPVNLVVTAVKNTVGEITGFLGLAEDITERKQAEERFHATVEAAPTAMLVVDADGRILLVNRRVEELFGYSRQEMIGQSVEMLIPDRYSSGHAAFREQFIPHAAPKDMGAGMELFAVRKDGTEFPVKVGLSPIGTGVGQAVICGVLDITDQKRTLAAIQQAKESAEASNRAKSSFLANMSHEIRTPMNGIIGMAQLLSQTELRSHQRDFLSTIDESAHILLRLLNDILDFSKIEAGKLELERTDFRISECVARATQMLVLRAAEKGIEIAGRVAPEIPDYLVGDAGRVQQVLVNLLANAVKFTEAGEIYVNVNAESTLSDKVRLHFSVSDTGIGIARDKQEQIFHPFEQAEASTTRRFGGTGLGLTISRQLVELMHGQMWVESEPGCGSRFHFTAEFIVAQDQHQRQTAELHSLQHLPVLVVDDNLTNRRILSELLQFWKMRPVLADSAEAARLALRKSEESQQPIRMILLDHHMPGEDGFHFAESIREFTKQGKCPIIMISSGSSPVDADQCQKHGIGRFMTKPVIASELLNEVLRQFGQFTRVSVTKPDEVSESDIQPRRVLLVEDNEINRRVALGLIRSRGHQAAVAENGLEAVNLIAEQEFDVVLMDMQMPVMDGYEATIEIRKREHVSGGHIPIVAMTAEALKGDRERCLAVGMDDYVSKPIASKDLYRAIERFPPLCLTRNSSGPVTEKVKERKEGTSGIQQQAEPTVPSNAPPKAAEDAVKSTPRIDLSELRELLSCGQDEISAFIQLMKTETPKMLADIRAAINAGDYKLLRRAAHTLKGSVSYFGVKTLTEAVLSVETEARAEAMEAIVARMVDLEQEVASFLEALANAPAGQDV